MKSLRFFAPAWRTSDLALTAFLLTATAGAHAASGTAMQRVQQSMQIMAVPFEANSGQLDERVAFMGKTFAGAVYVTRQGQIVYSLPVSVIQAQGADTGLPHDRAATPPRESGWSLTETLAGAQPLSPVGGQVADTQIHRFVGPHSYQAPTYRNLHLGQAWRGIEVELAARGNNVEKLFHVAPHADAKQIQVHLGGAKSLRLGKEGELIATTGHGKVAYTAPVAFQQRGGQRVDVPVRYVLNAQGDGYGFEVGAYDPALPLVIDPLLQSTYLGGGGHDQINALAITPSGDVVVGGSTWSTPFPGTAGGAQPGNAGNYDGFVALLSADLKTLQHSTYLGGSDEDHIRALAIAPSGDIVVVGSAWSADFPGTIGGPQPFKSNFVNGFATRLSADLSLLQQSTYVGGSANALAVTHSGDVVVGGSTWGEDWPDTQGGAQPNTGGLQDGFVALLSADLRTLKNSTYLGGEDRDQVTALAIAPSGDVVAGGSTWSSNFPGASGGARPGHSGGGLDGFVTRLSSDLGSLRQSTYLGGSSYDLLTALAIAPSGEVVAGGYTYSSDFPVTAGTGFGGYVDGFVARLSADLGLLLHSTYLGGWGRDDIRALALTTSGDVVVGGQTSSHDFPGVAGGVQPSYDDGVSDGFVARLSADLVLQQSTYLGRSGEDDIRTLAIPASGDVVVGGYTSSSDFPGVTGGVQNALGGSHGYGDGFITRLSTDLRAVSP